MGGALNIGKVFKYLKQNLDICRFLHVFCLLGFLHIAKPEKITYKGEHVKLFKSEIFSTQLKNHKHKNI